EPHHHDHDAGRHPEVVERTNDVHHRRCFFAAHHRHDGDGLPICVEHHRSLFVDDLPISEEPQLRVSVRLRHLFVGALPIYGELHYLDAERRPEVVERTNDVHHRRCFFAAHHRHDGDGLPTCVEHHRSL